MTEVAFISLIQRGLLLCLLVALPPLLGAALCGGVVAVVQSRLGVAEPSPPALARLLGGFAALLAFAPWLGHEVTRFSAALWAYLPALGH